MPHVPRCTRLRDLLLSAAQIMEARRFLNEPGSRWFKMQLTRQHAVDVLRRAGFRETAEDALPVGGNPRLLPSNVQQEPCREDKRMCNWFYSGLGHQNWEISPKPGITRTRGLAARSSRPPAARRAFLVPPSGEATMTAQPIAPVISSLTRPAGHRRAQTAAVRRLPLAAVPEIQAAADDVLYGFGSHCSPGWSPTCTCTGYVIGRQRFESPRICASSQLNRA